MDNFRRQRTLLVLALHLIVNLVVIVAAIQRNELGWFDKNENNSYQILARLNSDATNVRAAVGDRAAEILQNTTLKLASWIVSVFLQ